MPEIVSSHSNEEGEYATIERVTDGPFTDRPILVIHDDYPSPVRAPMLLDEGTVSWLRCELECISQATEAAGSGGPDA